MKWTRALLFLSASALLFATDAVTPSADAQGYVCPPGYYFDPYYGCLPLNYFYGPPYYVYPDFGFGFFYGPIGRGYRYGGIGPRGGVAPHGGFHGGGRR